MTDDEASELRKRCQEHSPAKLRCYREDELVREVPVPGNRKKWAHVLSVVGALRARWTSVELCDRAGAVLDVYAPQLAAAGSAPAALDTRIGGMELGAGADMVRMLIAGQREVLTYRERDNGQAMQAMVAMMDKMTSAVGVLANVHAATLEAQRQQAQLQVATVAQAAAAAAAAAPAAADDDGDELESMKMLKLIAPQLAEKFMEKFGPMLVGMLAPQPAKPAAKVIDVDTAKKAG